MLPTNPIFHIEFLLLIQWKCILWWLCCIQYFSGNSAQLGICVCERNLEIFVCFKILKGCVPISAFFLIWFRHLVGLSIYIIQEFLIFSFCFCFNTFSIEIWIGFIACFILHGVQFKQHIRWEDSLFESYKGEMFWLCRAPWVVNLCF